MNNTYNFKNDTPLSVRKKQVEIIQAKTNEEKLKLTAQIVDFCYEQTMTLLKKQLGTNDPATLKAAFVETFYKDDFSKEEMERIRIFLRVIDKTEQHLYTLLRFN